MINYYKKGQKVRETCTFTVNGVATDPTAVTVKVMTPSRVVSTYVYGTHAEVVKDATGVYHIDITTDAAGEWNVRFEGTGACVAVQEGAFGAQTVFP